MNEFAKAKENLIPYPDDEAASEIFFIMRNEIGPDRGIRVLGLDCFGISYDPGSIFLRAHYAVEDEPRAEFEVLINTFTIKLAGQIAADQLIKEVGRIYGDLI